MEDKFIRLIKWVTRSVSAVLVILLIMTVGILYFQYFYAPSILTKVEKNELMSAIDSTDVKEGVHVPSGLKADTHLALVIANCTPCHSSKLITQNRATAEGWRNLITWMQNTQNLWDLGEDRDRIVDYLAKNYAPVDQGRRKPLEIKEWYVLE